MPNCQALAGELSLSQPRRSGIIWHIQLWDWTVVRRKLKTFLFAHYVHNVTSALEIIVTMRYIYLLTVLTPLIYVI